MSLDSEAIAELTTLMNQWTQTSESADVGELDQLLSGVALFPPESLKNAAEVIAADLEKNPSAAVDITLKIIGSEEPATRAFAAVLISRFAQYQPALWKSPASLLAADRVWEVRQHGAKIFDTTAPGQGAAEFHADFVFDVIKEWVSDKNYLLRHSATQALTGWALGHIEQAEKLLALLEPLFNDSSEYVRAGAVLTLRALGRKRPQLVLSFIELRLDNLGEFERDTYRTLLDSHFAPAHDQSKERILSALSGSAPSSEHNQSST